MEYICQKSKSQFTLRKDGGIMDTINRFTMTSIYIIYGISGAIGFIQMITHLILNPALAIYWQQSVTLQEGDLKPTGNMEYVIQVATHQKLGDTKAPCK